MVPACKDGLSITQCGEKISCLPGNTYQILLFLKGGGREPWSLLCFVHCDSKEKDDAPLHGGRVCKSACIIKRSTADAY